MLALALALMTACTDPACDPGDETVQLLDELSAQQVQDVVEGYGLADAADMTCEMICLSTYQAERGWEWLEIATCTLDLDEEAYAAALEAGTLQAPVGQVACTGEGIEYLCG